MKQNLPWKTLDSIDLKIIIDLYKYGADCAKFISRRFRLDQKEVMNRLKRLEKLGFLKRVEGRFALIRGKYKHMNHTYYKVTRAVKLYLRNQD